MRGGATHLAFLFRGRRFTFFPERGGIELLPEVNYIGT